MADANVGRRKSVAFTGRRFALIASEARESMRCDGPVSLWNVGEVDVVVPHTPQTGKDLGEGSHDKVLAVPEINMIKALLHSGQNPL